MKIVVGLGNPGPKYETTRHNAGFLAIDRLVDHWNGTQKPNLFQSEIFEATFSGEKILLVKPLTFMNLSGRAVGPLLHFYKIPLSEMVVLHDEIDIPSFSIRIKVGGSAGGHNGIKSLDASLGSQEYARIRIGIGRTEPEQLRIPTEDFVLTPFTDNELEKLDATLEDVTTAVELVLTGKINAAMTQFNRKRKQDEDDGI